MDILGIITSLLILIYSSILHEIAHGYVAYRLGDPTAKLLGRLTLNPRPHIDLYMSVILPVLMFIGSGGRFIFGGAKPVPVDPFNLKDGIKDLALVSLAGPGTNILLAVVASLILHVFYPGFGFFEIAGSGIVGFLLTQIVELNLLLAIFNLLPIPPLDGSKVFALLLPERAAAQFLTIGQSMGMFLLIFLLFFPIGGFDLMRVVSSIINYSLRLLGF
ncbi:MAG TPA: site-2 protease family protein [Xanthomonadales bacterium]|nr:site-2 protease family protein [Xanthomonadales bacterium]